MILRCKKYLGGIQMTWLRTILFAVIAGIYTGLINQVAFLEETSFRDIAVSYEWWVLFAIIVVVNCQKPWEAALKCFLFFLVSQPLVFLTEVPKIGFDKALHYYRAYWLIPTLLTLPGGFIAFYAKQENLLGAAVLGLGNGIVAMMGVSYVFAFINYFPFHILTVLFCVAEVVIVTLCLQEKKRERILSFTISGLLGVAALILILVRGTL